MASASTGPELAVSLGRGLALATPVVAAAGSFGYGEEVADLADTLALGALITPTITVDPRSGNPMPRTAETSAGLLHSLGLPNPGVVRFIADRLPALQALPCPVLVSIRGETPLEWTTLATSLAEAGVVGVELNLTPISVTGETAILDAIGEAVEAVRAAIPGPLVVKLPAANVEVGTAAAIAEGAGADVIAVSQGFPGVAVRLPTARFRLPGVSGEVSGPCIKPLALYQVWRVAQTVRCPILGSGGIMTGEDAVEFLAAGASAVAVGIASSIHPAAIARISSEISSYLTAHGLSTPAELVGAALR